MGGCIVFPIGGSSISINRVLGRSKASTGCLLLSALCVLMALALTRASAFSGQSRDTFKSPDILVLGDSQLTFGSGPAFLDFFTNIRERCMPAHWQAQDLEKLGAMSVGVIGVRSTSLGSWTARKDRAKSKICKVDRKWRYNAATFGIVNPSGNRYVQIGKGEAYQFCKRGKSAFEAMFEEKYYQPKLLILSFLGNSAHRWAGNRLTAFRDVERTMSQLPSDMPCIFMTTAPTYKKRTVDLRLKAQQNVKYAFMKNSSRCSFVEGFTPRTVAANMGNKDHFRLRRSGTVKDPYHPNRKAAEKFLSMETTRICRAIFDQVGDPRHVGLQVASGPH